MRLRRLLFSIITAALLVGLPARARLGEEPGSLPYNNPEQV